MTSQTFKPQSSLTDGLQEQYNPSKLFLFYIKPLQASQYAHNIQMNILVSLFKIIKCMEPAFDGIHHGKSEHRLMN